MDFFQPSGGDVGDVLDDEASKVAAASRIQRAFRGSRKPGRLLLPQAVGAEEACGDRKRTPRRGRKFKKLLRNPVFHVKAASWVIFGLCYFCVRGPERPDFMKVNLVLERALPLLNDVLHRTLPATLGDCQAADGAGTAPPAPCIGNSAVYESKSTGSMGPSQEALVRWVTGLNTVELSEVSLLVIPDSEKPIKVEIRGSMVDIKMSIRVQQCLLSVCETLWDNMDGCCEPQRTFELIVGTDCVDGANGTPVLGDFEMERFKIATIELEEEFLGIFNEKVTDLTPKVKKTVLGVIEHIFNGEAVFMNYTFSQVVSRLWEYNTAGGVRCKDFLHDV